MGYEKYAESIWMTKEDDKKMKKEKVEKRMAESPVFSDPYEGWQDTIGSSIPCKKKRRRVHYAPHLVYGFR